MVSPFVTFVTLLVMTSAFDCVMRGGMRVSPNPHNGVFDKWSQSHGHVCDLLNLVVGNATSLVWTRFATLAASYHMQVKRLHQNYAKHYHVEEGKSLFHSTSTQSMAMRIHHSKIS